MLHEAYTHYCYWFTIRQQRLPKRQKNSTQKLYFTTSYSLVVDALTWMRVFKTWRPTFWRQTAVLVLSWFRIFGLRWKSSAVLLYGWTAKWFYFCPSIQCRHCSGLQSSMLVSMVSVSCSWSSSLDFGLVSTVATCDVVYSTHHSVVSERSIDTVSEIQRHERAVTGGRWHDTRSHNCMSWPFTATAWPTLVTQSSTAD